MRFPDFSEKVALVTGGGSGIGRATAVAFADAGASVAVLDIDGDAAEVTAAECRPSAGSVISRSLDVTDPEQFESIVSDVVDEFGRLDCAVNCAAVNVAGDRPATADTSLEAFDRIIDVGLRGCFISMRAELPPMLAQGSGSIVNLSSTSGLVATRTNPAYVATKHGVVGLTKAAALDYADAGIRVNVVAPGTTRTPMIDAISDEFMAKIEASIPAKRSAAAEEIADAILWLSSDQAKYAVGSVLVIDGGFTAQ